VHVLVPGQAQGAGQIFQTLAGTDRITFATDHQDRQVRVDLRQVARAADLLQPAEQVDPQAIAAAEAS